MASRKVVLFIAASLDGYIATENHGLDWLFEVEGEGDNGYGRFYDTVDTILIGRTTYDWIMEQDPNGFPYKGKECYVFSRTVTEGEEGVIFTASDPAGLARELKNKDGGKIWIVGGGDLLSAFIRENLVDEIFLSIAPVLLGKGIPLFRENDFQTSLSLKNISRFGQFVELHYEVVKQ